MSMSAGHDVVRFSVFQALPKMSKTLRKGAAYLGRSGCPKEVFLSKHSKKVVDVTEVGAEATRSFTAEKRERCRSQKVSQGEGMHGRDVSILFEYG